MIAPFLEGAPLVGLPIGVAFGVALERAGLGSAGTIAAQLRGRDFTVVKVMLTAIVTAMLGVFWATRLGWLDLSRVAIPETDLGPQLVGAALFGAGFAVASLCPGTACVAVGAGHRDGFATIVGMFVGTLVTAALWPVLGRIAESAPRSARLPDDLGLAEGAVVALIAIAGALAVWLAGRWERGAASGAKGHRARQGLAALAVTLGGLAAFASTRTPARSEREPPKPVVTAPAGPAPAAAVKRPPRRFGC